MSKDNVQMQIIKSEDADKVIQFLEEYYFPQAPIGSIEPKTVLTNADREDIRKFINYNCSIKAEEDGQLIGVTIALPKDRSCIDDYFAKAEKLGNTKLGQIMRMLGIVTRNAKIFEHYGVNEVLYLYYLSVAPSQRGRNISTRMTSELIELGKRLKYKALTIDCTSIYSAKVCERLGMECLNTLPYRDFVDESGKPIFTPLPPHDALKTYGIRL